MSKDAIVLLREDHQEVRNQFRAFRKQDQTPVQKQGIVDTILELLTVPARCRAPQRAPPAGVEGCR